MENFEKLNDEVDKGIRGLNSGVSMGFDRMDRFVGIRRRIMNLIFGASGSGKSAFMHSAYILNPFESIMRDRRPNLNFKVILFSMERSKIYILAKWVSRKIFLDEQVLIPIPKLLGWWKEKLTKDEHDLFLMSKDYINELESYVDIIEGPQNPTGKIQNWYSICCYTIN